MDKIIELEEGKGFYHVKAATRMMKGKPGKPNCVGSEDLKKLRELAISVAKGDKEAEYSLSQLNYEINEAAIRSSVNMLENPIEEARIWALYEKSKVKRLIAKGYLATFGKHTIKCIKREIERANRDKNRMETLAKELGKEEFPYEFDLSELSNKYKLDR